MQYKQFISRLFNYLKAHIGKLIFTSVMMIFATALESSIPEITGQIVDELFAKDRETDTAILYALAIFVVIILSSIFTITSIATSSWVSNKVIMHLRIDMFTKLINLPKSYFDKNASGKILSKLTFDVEQIAAAASTIWLAFIKSSLSVIILVSYLFYKNWQLSLTLVVLLPLVYLAVKASSNRMREASRNVQNSMGKMTHLLDENITGSSLVKIYHAQEQETAKFSNIIKNIRQQRFKVDLTGALNTGFVNILIGLSLATVVYFSSTLLQMTAGEFLSFFTAMGMLVKPAKNLVDMNKPLQLAMAAGESVFGLIDEQEEANDGKVIFEKCRGDIKFSNVSFGYNLDTLTLQNINLDIKSGETIALVGSTGSGKTTIIQLLTRFYNPSSGTITIDDKNINELELDSLRTQISFVDQNVRLFNDTVKGNIALGQIDKMTDDNIENAAKISHSYDFIKGLSNQFNTEIGEDGTNLSGGQRQRLSIARAIAKDCPILILDEATSSLDSVTEKQVQDAIEDMQKNRTTIIIAHRLSTVQKADRIIVLNNGQIIEQGTHEELLSLAGEYSHLYNRQFDN